MEKLQDSSDDVTLLRRKLFTNPIDDKNRKVLLGKFQELQSREYQDEEYYKLFSTSNIINPNLKRLISF